MKDPVKPKRRYDSRRRKEQAAETRSQILQAAQRLFERDGYGATTMAAVAAEAGVALKTVYLAFETKSGLLRALWHLLLRGDQQDVPVGDRDWYRRVLEEPDPRRRLELNASTGRAVKERAAALMDVIRSGAATDPDIAVLWERIQSDFHAIQRGIVETLDSDGALRPGLDVTHATDILWTLNNPDVWQLLVGRRGWTPEQWERWFAEASCSQLLRSAADSR
jgi:AcrR family transcriptional regulator